MGGGRCSGSGGVIDLVARNPVFFDTDTEQWQPAPTSPGVNGNVLFTMDDGTVFTYTSEIDNFGIGYSPTIHRFEDL